MDYALWGVNGGQFIIGDSAQFEVVSDSQSGAAAIVLDKEGKAQIGDDLKIISKNTGEEMKLLPMVGLLVMAVR